MSNPYEGWEQAAVGCHWSRKLPDGRRASMSTWMCGKRSGYSLVVDYVRRYFTGLEEAKDAYAFLAAEPGRSVVDVPGALDDSQL